MTSPKVRLDIDGRIARIVFCDPVGNNAMDLAWIRDFTGAALAVETNPDIRAIVIQAEGAMFSPGGDINDFVANAHRVHEHVLTMATEIHIGVASLRRAAAPVIASINGTTAGGAFSLICGADVVIARRSAKFAPAFTKSGLTPDASGTYFLPRIVGSRKAFWLFATNPVLTADQAAELGIVTLVVDDDKLEAETTRVAQSFVDSPSTALFNLKRLLNESITNPLDVQLNQEARSIAAMCASPETLQKLIAFTQKKR